jgi:hypothetical protein
VAGWPLVVAGVCGLGLAWARGWPPRRLAVAAVWCAPMLAVSAVSWAVWRGGGLHAAVTAPYRQWLDSWHALGRGDLWGAAAIIAPAAVPVGLLLGAVVWRSRLGLMAAGAAGWSPAAPVVFDERQWRRAARTAAQRARAPGGVPLLSARGNPNLGAVIRSVGHRPRALLELGYGALRSHMLVVGTTGAGKTTALVRLWAGFWAASTRRYRRGREARPWLLVINAKGGFDSRDTAAMVRGVLADLGVAEGGGVAG